MKDREKEVKDYKPEKVSKVRSRLFLWYQNRLDSVRRVPSKRDTHTEREKLYSQFVDRLIILTINGLAVGALLLAALDYLATANIPERSPVILTLFLVVTVYCAVYWGVVYTKGKGIDGVRGLAVFALVLSLLGSSAGVYSVYTNNKNLNTYYHGQRIEIERQKETAILLASYINIWRHTPNYSVVHVAEDAYFAVVYNSKGESLAQLVIEGDDSEDSDPTHNMTVVLNDGTAVIATETSIERRFDADNLKYVELALQWAARGDARLERYSSTRHAVSKSSVPKDGLPGTEYAVTISGIEQIKKFYSEIIGVDEANETFRALSTTNEHIELAFQVAIDTAYIGAAAYLNIGGTDSLMWYIDNYVQAYDWDLGDFDWYGYDYTDAEKNERMLQTALVNATSMLKKLSEELGVPLD